MFNISKSSLNMGHTMFENIFITDYMPYADGDYVKVYLLGFHFAAHNQQHLNLNTISVQLDMPIETVYEAFKYWENEGIIGLSTNSEDVEESEPYSNITIEFFSINDMYIIDNYKFIFPKEKLGDGNKNQNDDVQMRISELQDDDLEDNFLKNFENYSQDVEFMEFKNYVEKIRGKGLTEIDIRAINKYSIDKRMDYSLIKKAFEIAYLQSNIKSNRFAYMLGILNRWYDDDILTIDEYLHRNKNNYNTSSDSEYREIAKKAPSKTKKLDERSKIHNKHINTDSSSSVIKQIAARKKEYFRKQLYNED